jgi:biopolymer transport protein ExbB/TolQ
MIQMPMLAIILVFAHLLIVPQIYCQFFTFNPISNSVKDTNKKRQPVKQTEKEHDQLHNIYDNFEKIEDSFTKKLNPGFYYIIYGY